MNARALSPVQYLSEGFGTVKFVCWRMPVESVRWLRRSKLNSANSRGRMAELSRGNRFAGHRCPLPSC
jgi:hypothetical protein